MNRPQQPTGPRKSRSESVWGLILCTSLAVVATASGCSYYGNAFCAVASPYETVQCEAISEFRARIRARSIWASKYANCHKNHCNVKDIRDGFVDGFVDTCLGGDGCPPLFAPNGGCGLGLRDKCSAAWFQGYPLGAAAAESCGCGRRLRNSLVNPALLGCQQGCNAGCCPCENNVACQSCGEPAASCGCGHAAQSVPVPHPGLGHGVTAPIYHGDSVPTELPQVAPGETIVPGSIEMQYNEQLPSPSDVPEVAPAAPEPDQSAMLEQDILMAASAAEPSVKIQPMPTNTVNSQIGLIELAVPTDWNSIVPVRPAAMRLPASDVPFAETVVKPAVIMPAINSH